MGAETIGVVTIGCEIGGIGETIGGRGGPIGVTVIGKGDVGGRPPIGVVTIGLGTMGATGSWPIGAGAVMSVPGGTGPPGGCKGAGGIGVGAGGRGATGVDIKTGPPTPIGLGDMMIGGEPEGGKG
jgi:hypothetical protein